MRNNERARGVVLTMLDFGPVMEGATERYFAVHPEAREDFDRVEAGHGPYALGTAPDGKQYVLCNEGVGWTVSEHENFGLDGYARGETTFSMMPNITVHLTLSEVRAAATGEQVDLADLVRKFGSRLESNFALWFDTLGGNGRPFHSTSE